MRNEDIKRSFDKVKPNDTEKQRMLNNALYGLKNKRKVDIMKLFQLKKSIPIIAAALIISGSIFTYDLVLNKNNDKNNKGNYENSQIESEINGGKEHTNQGKKTDSANRVDNAAELINSDSTAGLELAQLQNQFQIGNRHYIVLSNEQKAEFKLPAAISKSDVGDKLFTITTSVDESLKGCEVFKYIPAGGESIVAIKKDNEYSLYKFFTFDSYNKNQDEDTITYLNLYGIFSSSDISKIQFIAHSDQAKIENRLDVIAEITDSLKIAEFYNYYSVIKNSSEKYFDKLFNYKSSSYEGIEPDNAVKELPPDYKGDTPVNNMPANDTPVSMPNIGAPEPAIADDTIIGGDIASDAIIVNYNEKVTQSNTVQPVGGIMYDMGETGVADGNSSSGSSGSSSGSTGSALNALNNSVTIRIYSKSGIYFNAEYYPNIGFISRHEVNAEFADFLRSYIE